MSEAAVAEPAVEAEAQDAPPESPQAVEGTGTEEESQPVETQAEEEADPEVLKLNQAAIEAAVDAEREKIRDEVTRDVLTKTSSQVRQEQAQQAIQNAAQLYGRTVAEVRRSLESAEIEDAYGNKVKLSPNQISESLKGLDAYNGRVLQAARQEALLYVEDAVFNVLPETVHEPFAKEAHGKPLEDYLHSVIEHGALASKAVKGMTLEEAAKASPKIKAELAARDASQFKAGRVKGRVDPVGEPRDGFERNGSSSGWTTKAEARNLHAQGKITDDQMRTIRNDPRIPDGY